MLISEYFQKIESQIADCIYIIETSLVKDKRSLHPGIIEGELFFNMKQVLRPACHCNV
ncbi:MAG: hypothetical protein J7M30_01900 [Deltaproteobacteria bacterium]|nr:hypothetical protein [Deltaproteobacteria bacterium]